MDKKFVGLISILFLSVFLLLLSITSQGSAFRAFNPRAQQQTIFSAPRSLMFAWPLITKSGNEIKIDVFIRNNDDKPIPNKNVILSSSLGDVKTITNPTDKSGKATFTLKSQSQGVATVIATVDNLQLTQKLSIKFE